MLLFGSGVGWRPIVIGALLALSLPTAALPASATDVRAAATTEFVAMTPARLLDTREGIGTAAGAIGPGGIIELQITGVEGIPADAVAVAVNVTSTQADATTFVTIWPTGTERPESTSFDRSSTSRTARCRFSRTSTATVGIWSSLPAETGNSSLSGNDADPQPGNPGWAGDRLDPEIADSSAYLDLQTLAPIGVA